MQCDAVPGHMQYNTMQCPPPSGKSKGNLRAGCLADQCELYEEGYLLEEHDLSCAEERTFSGVASLRADVIVSVNLLFGWRRLPHAVPWSLLRSQGVAFLCSLAAACQSTTHITALQ